MSYLRLPDVTYHELVLDLATCYATCCHGIGGRAQVVHTMLSARKHGVAGGPALGIAHYIAAPAACEGRA